VVTCAPNFPEGKLFPGYRNAWRQIETVDGIRVVRVKTYITATRFSQAHSRLPELHADGLRDGPVRAAS